VPPDRVHLLHQPPPRLLARRPLGVLRRLLGAVGGVDQRLLLAARLGLALHRQRQLLAVVQHLLPLGLLGRLVRRLLGRLFRQRLLEDAEVQLPLPPLRLGHLSQLQPVEFLDFRRQPPQPLPLGRLCRRRRRVGGRPVRRHGRDRARVGGGLGGAAVTDVRRLGVDGGADGAGRGVEGAQVVLVPVALFIVCGGEGREEVSGWEVCSRVKRASLRSHLQKWQVENSRGTDLSSALIRAVSARLHSTRRSSAVSCSVARRSSTCRPQSCCVRCVMVRL
jgi:hypothetical protein